jgi:hypothetical protein
MRPGVVSPPVWRKPWWITSLHIARMPHTMLVRAGGNFRNHIELQALAV